MIFKRVLPIVIIITLMIGITGCSTIDMISGLKENPEIATGPEFAIIEDIIDEADDGLVETITVNSDIQKKGVTAYFQDENGYVVPVNLNIPSEEGIAKATLNTMVVGSPYELELAQSGIHGVLPEGTAIIGMSIDDGLCTVDFTRNILNTQSYEDEERMMTALTYTLTEFDTIKQVQIQVGGQSLDTLSKGYGVDTAFNRQNINLFGDADGNNYMVYFKTAETETDGYFVPVTFTADSVDNPVHVVLTELFNGAPDDTLLYNEVPLGVGYQGVTVSKGVATVDLSMGALNLAQEDYDDLTQIVTLCLQQFDDISQVEFSVEGMTLEQAGLDLVQPNVTAVFNEINGSK